MGACTFHGTRLAGNTVYKTWNFFPWAKLIAEHIKRGQSKEALEVYKKMRDQGLTPKTCTFVAVLKACSSLADLQTGKEIHAHVMKSGDESDIFVASTLVYMYVKCGSMAHARQVFEKMPYRNLVAWNSIIMGYAKNQEGELALQLFVRMQREGFTPDARTFVSVLKACYSQTTEEKGKQLDNELVKVVCLQKGRAIHSQVAKSGFESDIFVATTLVDMYAKCGSMMEARGVFERMPQRNMVSWSAMIKGYIQMNKEASALLIYARLQQERLTPDAHTFVAALKACSRLAEREEGKVVNGEIVKIGCLEKGRTIHSQVAKARLESDVFVASTLVDMYVKCGSMVDAHQVFEKMPYRNVVSWTSMIMGYTQREQGELALQLYVQMQREGLKLDAFTFVAVLKACCCLAAQEEGKQVNGEIVKVGCLEKGRDIHTQVAKSGLESDVFVASTLVHMYVKCGCMVDARHVFERMPFRDVVSWTTMIMGYAQMEKGESALQLYARMQHEGITPNAYTFAAALIACGSLSSLEMGKKIHAEICRIGLKVNAFVTACLIDMYGKCGNMVDAQQSFDASVARDVVCWSALIAGYSSQGDNKHVFSLLERMKQENIKPVGTTFVSVLALCSRAGLVDKGLKYFHAMCLDYGIIPATEHYTCMVDLLGRAGQLDEAVAMMKKMPFKPDMVMWIAILGACQKWKNVEVGKHVFDCAVRLDEKQASAFVLMTNIYASAYMWKESAEVQAMRKNAGAWEKPGWCWWTDNTGMVHTFSVGDKNHPKHRDIYAKLKHLSAKMEEHGVLRNICDDEKEDVLCGHIDKLAVAYALINTHPGTTIRIVKNLRVCDDCHNVTALISKIEQRTIICRDANQLHVYNDGECSCGDFCDIS